MKHIQSGESHEDINAKLVSIAERQMRLPVVGWLCNAGVATVALQFFRTTFSLTCDGHLRVLRARSWRCEKQVHPFENFLKVQRTLLCLQTIH